MANVNITTQPVSITTIPGRDTTFSVVAANNFPNPVTYLYQWQVDNVDILGATTSVYAIDPRLDDDSKSFTVSVSAVDPDDVTVALDIVLSNAAVLTVQAENTIHYQHAVYPETGNERFLRMRNLGYF